MEITKIETNYKRNLFFDTKKISPKTYKTNMEKNIINIYDIPSQEFIGFGGAITEASGYAYSLLPENEKTNFINDYFRTLNYTLCRLCIGSSDFSLDSYSYSKQSNLEDFSIQRDFKYIIPLIKDILKVNPDIKFLASPWSPPKFMKNNRTLSLGGKLLDNFKQTYAEYLAKYIIEYKQNGISIDYITIQNEPNATQVWESCLFTSGDEVDFLTNYLYPTFSQKNINTKVLIYDHNKDKLFTRAVEEFSNKDALKDASGIAYHSYTGDFFDNISLCKTLFPNKLLIHSEGCVGFSHFNPNDEVMNAEIYAHDIVGDLNAGCNGYIDWNILLNHNGGPNHKKNFCNSPVMLDKDLKSYYKNLCYYYIGQFSSVIKKGAVKIAHSSYTSNIEITAFKNKDNSIAIVLLNRNDFNQLYNICFGPISISDNLDSHAIVSYIIK